MKAWKKTAIRVVLGLLALFLLVNLAWCVWRMAKYGTYSKGMEKTYFSTWIVPRYGHTDADGFDYSVKYPEYLSLTGNLCVGLPTTDENPFTDFLIIWPKWSGGYEYGVSLTIEGVTWQIYIRPDGSVVDPEYSEIAARCRDTIDTLLERAGKMWDLE